ncbi:hypothetical protein GIB67_039104, partial [Kingdonia uniflora]
MKTALIWTLLHFHSSNQTCTPTCFCRLSCHSSIAIGIASSIFSTLKSFNSLQMDSNKPPVYFMNTS